MTATPTRNLRHAAWALACVLFVGAPPAGAADGLHWQADAPSPWPALQTRLRLGFGVETHALGAQPRLTSAQWFGDYFFSPTVAAEGLRPSGWRATSGLWFESRRGQGMADAAPATDDNGSGGGDAAVLPYLGVGYSVMSANGFSLSADLGVLALRPDAALGLGAVSQGQRALDDLLRELKLRPVLQLGVSYSF